MPWKIEPADGAVVVTMNTNRVNAQNEDFFADLHRAFDTLDAQHPKQPVVLTADGDTFSAGIDFKTTFPLFARGDLAEIAAWFERYRATNLRLFTAARPMIAAINGHAMAGGLITALACDLRIAVSGTPAKFGLNEVPVGVSMPSVYCEIIRYAMGSAACERWTLLGRVYSGEEAHAQGALHELVPADALMGRALELARQIKPATLDAYINSKRALRAPALQTIETLSAAHDASVGRAFISVALLKSQADALRGLSAHKN